MPLKVEYGDITQYKADAMVIPANPKPRIGKGVDQLIYNKAGRNRLLNSRKAIGDIAIGDAELTSSFDLYTTNHVSWLVHAVSPAWDDGKSGEEILLKACYVNALNKTHDRKCKSIVFPLLSAGVLKFPKDIALSIAKEACQEFCDTVADMDITLVLFNPDQKKVDAENGGLDDYIYKNTYVDLDVENYQRLEREWADLPEWREESEILGQLRTKYRSKLADEKAYEEFKQSQEQKYHSSNEITAQKLVELDQYLSSGKKADSFSDVFVRFCQMKNAGSNTEICKRALLDKGTLSKYLSETRSVKRDYLWALAFALWLNIDETEKLFNSCGLSIHGHHRLDWKEEERECAFEFFMKQKIYDLDYINYALDKRGYKMLGNQYLENQV